MRKIPILIGLAGISLAAIWVFSNRAAWPDSAERLPSPARPQPTTSAGFTVEPTKELREATGTPPVEFELPIQLQELGGAVAVLALREYFHTHLYLFHPDFLPLTRLTFGDWDDITPALSPDGERLAFASDRNGAWDLYTLDLGTGEILQITDTPEYDAGPTWSPDGLFLAYESLVEGNLEILIASLDQDEAPIRLTEDPGPDHSPVWSPLGREIAFVSVRSGQPDIWVADLQDAGDRFRNLTASPEAIERRPAWSPDGLRLVWAAVRNGLHEILIGQADGQSPPTIVGQGSWPVWSPSAGMIIAGLEAPNQVLLTGFSLQTPGLIALPALRLPGKLEGLVWGTLGLADPLPAGIQAAASAIEAGPTLIPAPLNGGQAEDREKVVLLEGVQAPDPRLRESVVPAFHALRERATAALGWDYLASLDQAFIPLTTTLPPGLGQDWLYTGQAIAVSTAPLSAGWLFIVREDFGQQTYWRVYLRARFQDGSQGRPIYDQTWDFDARYSGDPNIYESGGVLDEAAPEGYWVDFTEIARVLGWERLPALVSWRTYYQAARFNEFVFQPGLGWREAMLALYPPEVLVTPSPITPVTPSATPTRTPSPTPSRSPTAKTGTPPLGSATPAPSSTPTP